MIIIKLIGGLGNQMFQYALGRKLALLKKTELKLDLSHYENQSISKTIREYQLNIFNINAKIANNKEIDRLTHKTKTKLFRKTINFYERFVPYFKKTIVKEQTKNFDPNIFKVKKNCYLIGFWQTEKYFANIRDILIKDFMLKKELDKKNKLILQKIKKNNSISIHIRRGDYIYNPHYNKVHKVLGIKYYKKAISIINQQIKNPLYIFFSDDIEWVKEYFSYIKNAIFIDFNKISPYYDMFLMSQCKHNIIANSTFSWWGAWLNQNPYKIVIAPKKWYKIESFNSDDLVPKNWIKI